MKTWNDKVSILKINLPTMESIYFVFTNTWTRDQNKTLDLMGILIT